MTSILRAGPRFRLALIAAAAASLAACSTVAPTPPAAFSTPQRAAPGPEDATDAPMTYACREGKRFVAAYALSGEHAVVQAGGGHTACRTRRQALAPAFRPVGLS